MFMDGGKRRGPSRVTTIIADSMLGSGHWRTRMIQIRHKARGLDAVGRRRCARMPTIAFILCSIAVAASAASSVAQTKNADPVRTPLSDPLVHQVADGSIVLGFFCLVGNDGHSG